MHWKIYPFVENLITDEMIYGGTTDKGPSMPLNVIYANNGQISISIFYLLFQKQNHKYKLSNQYSIHLPKKPVSGKFIERISGQIIIQSKIY